MKALLKFLFLFCAILVFGQTDSVSADSPNLYTERILSFNSEILVNKNAGIEVTEHIKVNALGSAIRRGIFRTLPLERNLNNKTQKVKYDVVSVKKNGIEEDYHTETGNGFLKIYIGNKDVLLDNGIYDYEIKYNTPNQVGFFSNYDEFYWNVNGTFWDFPVDKVSAKVTLPTGAEIVQNSCNTGSYGSSVKNCSSNILNHNQIEWTAAGLGSNENLTIAVGFKKGIILPPPPPTFWQKYGVEMFLALVFLWLLYYLYTSWNRHGRDPQKPVVYPQFNAPQNLSPASLGYINYEVFKNNFLTAALVNLAVKGYIRINESKNSDGISRIFGKKEYILEKLKDSDESLPEEEKLLMKRFFMGKTTTMKMDGSYDPVIETAVKTFESNLGLQHDKMLNEGNNRKKLLLPAIVIVVAYVIATVISARMNGEPMMTAIFLPALVLVGGGLFLYFRKSKFGCSIIGFMIFGFMWFSSMAVGLMKSILSDGPNSWSYVVFLILSVIVMAVYAWLIKKPTTEKLETLSQIEGFKMYMGAAENEQLKFHNPPQMTPQVFETFLPYAIVLGVDKIWGEKFANVMAAAATAYTANWYSGGTFNTVNFGSTLNSNLSSSISSASTAPSSSSSGSGGGGFSGGGGGGGGGGGW